MSASSKKLIKEENLSSLGHIDAKNLELWDVSFPSEDLSSINRPTGAGLGNAKVLWELFRRGLSGIKSQAVHIVVDIPESKCNKDSGWLFLIFYCSSQVSRVLNDVV